jgi:hypothetical protein
MPDLSGGDKGYKSDKSRGNSNVSDDSLRDLILFVKESPGKYTALMWVDYSDENVATPDSNSQKDIQSKFIDIMGRDYEKTDKKQKTYHMTTKSKAIIVITVLLLSCLPLLPVIIHSDSTSSVTMEMSNPEIIGSEFADGVISIKQESIQDDINYSISYTGSARTSTWYLYCNEDTAYLIENGNYVKRDFIKIGTGSNIVVSGSIMHIGSYQIKLVTESDVYTGTVVIDGDVTSKYTWNFVGVGGSTISSNVVLDYRFMDYYIYYSDSDIGRKAYSDVAGFAVVNPIIKSLDEAMALEYKMHYGMLDPNWYVDYILSFVQECFSYPSWSQYPDLFVYGQYEYFAYPMETIFRDTGDCEDTSILCAALFESAGYDSAVVLLYTESSGKMIGHSTAAVNVDKLVSDHNVNSNLRYCEMIYDGIAYRLCETTVKSQLAVGYIETKYINSMMYIYPVDVIG